MSRKSNKTPQEAVLEAQQALERAKARQAKEMASDSPLIQSLNDYLDGINKSIAAISRKMSGVNSFENRIRAAQAKLAWIDAEQSLSTAQDELLRAQKASLQDHINNLAERIASGEDIDQDPSDIIDQLPSADLSNLEAAFEDANETWRNLTPAALRRKEESGNVQSMEAGE